jgi:hypothetical protein
MLTNTRQTPRLLLGGTVEASKIQAQADRLRMTLAEQVALRSDAVAPANSLAQNQEIVEPDAAAFSGGAADIIGEGRHAERGTYLCIVTLKHISTVLISAAIIAAPAHYLGGILGAGVTMAAWEAMKKSATYAAATAALGGEFNRILESGGTAAESHLARLAPFRRFVLANEPHLRRIAGFTPQLRWMLAYLDY